MQVAKSRIKKILLLRFSSLGDIMMTTAMVRCVRKAYPLAQIDMVVRGDYGDLIRDNPYLDQKITLSRKAGARGLWGLLKALNRERYDLIYDAHRSLRTLFLMPFLDTDAKCYFKKHYIKRSVSLTFKVPLIRGMDRFLNRYIEPMEPWGVKWDGKGPELFVPHGSFEAAAVKVGFPVNEQEISWVGLIPSAQWPGKRWPAEHFRTLLGMLLEKTDHRFFVFGGKSDRFCKAICEGYPENRVINTQGKLRIAEAAALIEKCSYVVSNDTGLMHVADGLGIPSVLILGPTSGDLGCLPFHPQARTIEKDLWCRPCSKNGQAPCIRKRRYCVEDISPEAVFEQTVMLEKSILRGKS